jgi:hypothetical protein
VPNKKPIAVSTTTPNYTEDEIEWIMAVEKYRKENKVYYPSSVDLLRLAKSMGYNKTTGGSGEKS